MTRLQQQLRRPKLIPQKGCVFFVVFCVAFLTCCFSGMLLDFKFPLHFSEVTTVGGVKVKYQTYYSLPGFIPSICGVGGSDKHTVRIKGDTYSTAVACPPFCGYVAGANAILLLERVDEVSTNAVAIDVDTGRVTKFSFGRGVLIAPFESIIGGCRSNGLQGTVIGSKDTIDLWQFNGHTWEGVRLHLLTGDSDIAPPPPPQPLK